MPRVHPELSDVAEGIVTVTPFGEQRADLNPITVRGGLSTAVRFATDNWGNAPLEISLIGKDDEGALTSEEAGEPTWMTFLATWLVLFLALFLAAAVEAGPFYLPFTNLRALVFPPQPSPVSVEVQAKQPPLPRLSNAPEDATVTILHGDLALTAIESPRGNGTPAPVVKPTDSGPERSRTWTSLRNEDGSSTIIPGRGRTRVLERSTPLTSLSLASVA
jgi:hypothetical protein